MDLGDTCHHAAFQALDHVHLPWRAVAMQRSTHHLGGEIGQLGHSSGLGQGGGAHVVIEVEVGILHPHRMVKP